MATPPPPPRQPNGATAMLLVVVLGIIVAALLAWAFLRANPGRPSPTGTAQPKVMPAGAGAAR